VEVRLVLCCVKVRSSE